LWNNLPDTCPHRTGWLEEHGTILDGPSGMIHQEQEQEHETETEQEKEKEQTTTNMTPTWMRDSSMFSSSSAGDLFRSVLGSELNRLDRETLAGTVAEQEAWHRQPPEGATGAEVDGEGWVQAAIRAANVARDPNQSFTLAFVEAILRSWLHEGFQAPWNGAGGQDGFVVAEFWGEPEAA
jgi:hypothetical protein